MPLTQGPFIGAVTGVSAQIWVRAIATHLFDVEYRQQGEREWRSTIQVPLRSERDFTAAATLEELAPLTVYEYRIRLDGIPDNLSLSTFKTLPAEGFPSAFSFAIGADLQFGHHPYRIFDAVAERNPAFMLLLGDQIYADKPTLIEDSKRAYEQKYQENWSERHFQSLGARVPLFMIWDDHEIDNNWDEGMGGRYVNARLAYDEYQGQNNPRPLITGELFYSFKVADCGFFVLDTRSYRSPNQAADNANKTMLGATQKQELLGWLRRSRDRFKFLVSSVPWNDFSTTNGDAWDGFATERNQIFDAICIERISGVVLLSGDQHWSGIFRITHQANEHICELKEIMPSPLGVNTRRATAEPVGDNVIWKFDEGKTFGLVRVDTMAAPSSLDVSIHDETGKQIFPTNTTFRITSPLNLDSGDGSLG